MVRLMPFVAATALLAACQSGAQRRDEIQQQHSVTYEIDVDGAAGDGVEVAYAGQDGGTTKTEVAHGEHGWSTTVTAGNPDLHITAEGGGADRLTCVITVDRREVARVGGERRCRAEFELQDR
jgi:hypothetical protein